MSQPSAGVASAIAAAARLTGVSASYLTATAQRESAFDPAAKAGTSSAAGLYQFIESTWLSTFSKHASDLGLEKEAGLSRDKVLELRYDPGVSALLAGALAADNADVLRQRLGRAPTDGELYAAHVLGAGGAAKLIAATQAEPDRSAAEMFPAAAKANHGLFYDHKNGAVSAAALTERLTSLGETLIDPRDPSRAHGAPAAPASVSAPAPQAPAPAPARAPGASTFSSAGLSPHMIAILAALDVPERAKPDDAT
jgi:hypothetical protein